MKWRFQSLMGCCSPFLVTDGQLELNANSVVTSEYGVLFGHVSIQYCSSRLNCVSSDGTPDVVRFHEPLFRNNIIVPSLYMFYINAIHTDVPVSTSNGRLVATMVIIFTICLIWKRKQT
mmetsp:Transcript_52085/g.52454  ORF Transcript_52085/g.52454 Transcript_52085/m.52454 type:complete len:119 (+) Transcript_52085:383-739(+)